LKCKIKNQKRNYNIKDANNNVPFEINPFSSASRIIYNAALSLTEPPGFINSAFAKMLQPGGGPPNQYTLKINLNTRIKPVFSDNEFNFNNGVFPTAPMKLKKQDYFFKKFKTVTLLFSLPFN
jgi:hypothetical protein